MGKLNLRRASNRCDWHANHVQGDSLVNIVRLDLIPSLVSKVYLKHSDAMSFYSFRLRISLSSSKDSHSSGQHADTR